MTVVNFLFDTIWINCKPKKLVPNFPKVYHLSILTLTKKGNILKFPLDQGMSVGLNWAIYEYISFPHALGGVRFESLLECL